MSERCERTNKRRNECPSSLDASVPESFYSPQDSAAVFAACARCNHVDVERNVNNQPTTRKFMAFPLFLPLDLFFFECVSLFFRLFFFSSTFFFQVKTGEICWFFSRLITTIKKTMTTTQASPALFELLCVYWVTHEKGLEIVIFINKFPIDFQGITNFARTNCFSSNLSQWCV